MPYSTSFAEKVMLAKLFRAMMAAPNSSCDPFLAKNSTDWAQYVHWIFNRCHRPQYCGHLALQVHLRWSRSGLTIAALVPLLPSLAVGIWYTITNENSDDGVSAAWM